MKTFESKDLVAMLVIVAMIIFKITGHNGSLDVSIAIIIGYYFARRQDSQVVIPKSMLNPPKPQELREKNKRIDDK